MTEIEERFLEQVPEFLQAAIHECAAASPEDLSVVTDRQPVELVPTIIDDYRSISVAECSALRRAFENDCGVAYFLVANPEDKPRGTHPLFDIVEQLLDYLPLSYPLPHPLERHPEARARFGGPDGTVKIYDLPIPVNSARYREQAETSEYFALHHDGLGSGGTVETVVLYTDTPPLCGGYTFFQNVVRLSLELARSDSEAFRHLFLPNAITILRPRGKGAIRVTTPVLFLNEVRRPQSFYRVASGEYIVRWRADLPALDRAKSFLARFSAPFSYGSSFVHLSGRGHGCFIRNGQVAHGRSAFRDNPTNGRCLSRKWYMRSSRDASYKHVPGMFIAHEFARLYTDLFGEDALIGEWNYDQDSDRNHRLR
jgi:hypothetical protein